MSIIGFFDGANDAFDKKRRALNLNISAGTALKTALGKTKETKVETASTDPYITGVTDKLNNTADTVKIGSITEIIGSASNSMPKMRNKAFSP